MDNKDVFDKNINLLKKLFPNLNQNDIAELRNQFNNTEDAWHRNVERYPVNKLNPQK